MHLILSQITVTHTLCQMDGNSIVKYNWRVVHTWRITRTASRCRHEIQRCSKLCGNSARVGHITVVRMACCLKKAILQLRCRVFVNSVSLSYGHNWGGPRGSHSEDYRWWHMGLCSEVWVGADGCLVVLYFSIIIFLLSRTRGVHACLFNYPLQGEEFFGCESTNSHLISL